MFKLFGTKLNQAIKPTFQISVNLQRYFSQKGLYIGNLPWTTQRTDLLSLFVKYGPILRLYYPVDPQGRHKGFAFVDLKEEQADMALNELTGAVIGGRDIKISVAANQPNTIQDRTQFPSFQRNDETEEQPTDFKF